MTRPLVYTVLSINILSRLEQKVCPFRIALVRDKNGGETKTRVSAKCYVFLGRHSRDVIEPRLNKNLHYTLM